MSRAALFPGQGAQFPGMGRDLAARFPEAAAKLTKWVDEGKIVNREDIQEGIENAPETFLRLFRGQNIGKQLLKVGEAS